MAKRRLGRGLDSLIGPGAADPLPTAEAIPGAPSTVQDPTVMPLQAAVGRAAGEAPRAGTPVSVPSDKIDPNPYQPRKDFDDESLQELMASISSNGIIQPLIVRLRPHGGYELVAGERRLRAALALGLAEVPAVVKDVPDERMLELALIENIQRADLNPIEKAEAFRDFLVRCHLTQEEAARRIGVDRATLANHFRLLDLPSDIQMLVRRGALGMSHARTIASLADPADQLAMAKRAIRQELSVRQLENLVARMAVGRRQARVAPPSRSPQASAIQDELRRVLGTKVLVDEGPSKGSGRIIIEYYTYDDFDRIMSVLRR